MFTALTLSLVLAQKPGSDEITVYNQGFALVKEVRSLDLKSGRQMVEVRYVPSQIDSTSVGIRSLSNQLSLNILEQNYQYDLISPLAILNKSVGQHVRFIRTIGNQRDVLEGVLLNAPNAIVANADGSNSQTYSGMAIKTTDGRIVLDPTGEIEVTTLPSGLISVPTLMWDLEADRGGKSDIELSYITKGVNWSADYVFTLDGGTNADLQGWVTIDNQSGTTWQNAKLKLLAGDVNVVQPPNQVFEFAARGGFGGGGANRPAFQEQGLFEYHLYTLQRPATVRNKETKQIGFVEGHGVPFTKKLIVDSMQGLGESYPGEGEVGTGPIHTQVRVEFMNDETSHLGMALPKGKFRVYQRDSEGSVQMLGEAQINHTPRNERISLPIGNSFDVVASRKRTSYHSISPTRWEETFEVEVRNRKTTPETVHVYERKWGDWSITQKNHEFVKLDSNTADFVLKLKPNEVQTVAYTVVTKW